MKSKPKYTCAEYREEMALLGLMRRLGNTRLSEDERKKIEEEIHRLELEMGMD